MALIVAFYGALCFLFAHHRPAADSLSPAMRQQQREADAAGPAAADQSSSAGTAATGAVHNPPGSVDGVVVLGMHRSGTSMITGLLQRMGLHLGGPGTLLGAVPGENDKGFFERIQVINQNDNLMRDQNVNWALNVFRFDHLKALRAALGDQRMFAEGMAALAFYNDPAHTPWAVKDPRLCITLKFWMAFWKTPPAVLLLYRHPIEVRPATPQPRMTDWTAHTTHTQCLPNLSSPTRRGNDTRDCHASMLNQTQPSVARRNPFRISQRTGRQVARPAQGVRANAGPALVDGVQPVRTPSFPFVPRSPDSFPSSFETPNPPLACRTTHAVVVLPNQTNQAGH